MATKATPFTFTVTISAKEVKALAQQIVDNVTDYDFSDEAIKASGVKPKELVAQVMADPKFLKYIGLSVQRTIDTNMEYLYDDLADESFKCLEAAEKVIRAADQKLIDTYEDRLRDQRIKEAKSLLQNNGYTVS